MIEYVKEIEQEQYSYMHDTNNQYQVKESVTSTRSSEVKDPILFAGVVSLTDLRLYGKH